MAKKLKIGDKVKMAPALVRWNLSHEHATCATVPGKSKPDAEYFDHVEMNLCHLMGVPVIGTIEKKGYTDCCSTSWGVTWRLGKQTYFEYNDSRQLIKVD